MKINIYYKISVSIILLLIGVGSSVGAIPQVEREALIALYNSTNGDNWTNNDNWLGPPGTEGSWYGVTYDSGKNHVDRLMLGKNNLVGQIPSELGNLESLHRLDLHNNKLSGTIPPELGDTECYMLELSNNQLSGTIPPELAKQKYIWLGLNNNQLSGSIPSELANTDIIRLDLHNNKLSGPIPPELGKQPWKVLLDLRNNELTGPIPPELGNIKELVNLGLSNNQLSGSIPPELGNLTKLEMLLLSNNTLSGSIPPELGNLESLEALSLENNQLSGNIPPELGNLKECLGLGLRANLLSGSIPQELGKLEKLKNDSSLFNYNSLYTNDASLRKFLNSKQHEGDWEGTQTVAPTNVTASSLTEDSIKVSWTPIRFKEFSGGYRVFYSTSSGGPYTLFGTTGDKKASFLNVAGLNPGTTYYFVVQTVTHPHDLNNNTVVSEYSEEASGSQRP